MTSYEEWSRAGWAAHLPAVADIPAHVAGLGEATIPGLAAESAAGRALATAQGALFDMMLAHMDANGDRVISRDEFVAAVGPGVGYRPGFDTAGRRSGDYSQAAVA